MFNLINTHTHLVTVVAGDAEQGNERLYSPPRVGGISFWGRWQNGAKEDARDDCDCDCVYALLRSVFLFPFSG